MDMDTTIKGIPLKEEKIKEIVQEIINIDVNDGIKFEIDYYATSGPPIQSIESLDFHLESAYTHLESSKMSHARFSMAYS